MREKKRQDRKKKMGDFTWIPWKDNTKVTSTRKISYSESQSQ